MMFNKLIDLDEERIIALENTIWLKEGRLRRSLLLKLLMCGIVAIHKEYKRFKEWFVNYFTTVLNSLINNLKCFSIVVKRICTYLINMYFY